MRRNGFINVLIWTLVILLIVGLTYGVFTLFNGVKYPDEDDPIVIPKDPVITATMEGYTVYKLSEISFPFVIARVTFESEEAMFFDISDLITSEQLSLAQTQVYQDDLLSNGLFLSYQMVEFELPRNKKSFSINLFIPVKNPDAQKITVTTRFKSDIKLEFDLSFVQGVKEMLGYVEDDPTVITDNDKYKLKILGLEDLTNTTIMQRLSDGESEQAEFSSQARVIGVKLLIEPLGGKIVTLKDSRLKLKDGTVIALALDSSYFIEGYVSTLDHQFQSIEESYLIFDIYSDTQELLNMALILEIKFEGEDDWITILINE
ncbi:MAG: hypothetical protein Q8S15_08940 [Erysipelotrichaceae bacterium]|nr:hypothetical protein [Erysipelotrichaceae bacterium]